ncbi:hypothetical protein TELCIR_26263, partial [Teladorsagia circumcincta]
LAADLELAPRQRVKVDIEEADDGDVSASDGEAENNGKKKRKKALEALAQDAELEEHSAEELRKLAEALLEGCEKAEQDHELKKNEIKVRNRAGGLVLLFHEYLFSSQGDTEKAVKERGPWFKFAGVVDVNVRAIRKLHKELEPLHSALSGDAADDFKPPHKARPQKGWDVEWSSVDDAALLRGVYKYGIGSWEAIKMDPQLGLADKIFLKDKQRVDYLLKLMDKSLNGTKAVRVTNVVNRKRKAPDDDQSKSTPVEEK